MIVLLGLLINKFSRNSWSISSNC